VYRKVLITKKVAQNHGRAAASAIAGKPVPFDKTPIFWSSQGAQLRYVGHGGGYDDIFIKGNPDEMKVSDVGVSRHLLSICT